MCVARTGRRSINRLAGERAMRVMRISSIPRFNRAGSAGRLLSARVEACHSAVWIQMCGVPHSAHRIDRGVAGITIMLASLMWPVLTIHGSRSGDAPGIADSETDGVSTGDESSRWRT